MPIYELIRNQVFDMPPASDKARRELERTKKHKVTDEESLSKNYVIRAAAGGIISGAVAQFICSPTDLLKVRVLFYFRYNVESFSLIFHLGPNAN